MMFVLRRRNRGPLLFVRLWKRNRVFATLYSIIVKHNLLCKTKSSRVCSHTHTDQRIKSPAHEVFRNNKYETSIFTCDMSIKTLSSGTNVVEYMPMTTKAIPCPAYQQILSNVGFQEGQGSGEKAGSIPQASVLKDMNHNVRKTRNQRVGGRYKREKQP